MSTQIISSESSTLARLSPLAKNFINDLGKAIKHDRICTIAFWTLIGLGAVCGAVMVSPLIAWSFSLVTPVIAMRVAFFALIALFGTTLGVIFIMVNGGALETQDETNKLFNNLLRCNNIKEIKHLFNSFGKHCTELSFPSERVFDYGVKIKVFFDWLKPKLHPEAAAIIAKFQSDSPAIQRTLSCEEAQNIDYHFTNQFELKVLSSRGMIEEATGCTKLSEERRKGIIAEREAEIREWMTNSDKLLNELKQPCKEVSEGKIVLWLREDVADIIELCPNLKKVNLNNFLNPFGMNYTEKLFRGGNHKISVMTYRSDEEFRPQELPSLWNTLFPGLLHM